jgi:septum formation protein
MTRLILGSSSPRRKDLLSELGLTFEILIPDIDESFPIDMPSENVSLYVAERKFNFLLKNLPENDILICADTVVILNNQILGKPNNYNEAIEMLMLLSDNWHEVITGVVMGSKEKSYAFSVESKVKFTKISKIDAQKYIKEYNPLDKAGSYGVQDWIGLAFIERIEGSYSNIVGLPTHEVYQKLQFFK